MKQTSYLLVYKDGKRAPIRYFGPFVDRKLASIFEAELPMPKVGGLKKVRIVQPFTLQDAGSARQAILQERSLAKK